MEGMFRDDIWEQFEPVNPKTVDKVSDEIIPSNPKRIINSEVL